MKSRLSKFLAHLATAFILLNSLGAYGACCLPAETLLSEPQVSDQKLPPCHEQPAATEHSEALDLSSDCCATCLSAVHDTLSANHPTITPAITFSQGDVRNPVHLVDPPFRPPTLSLS